MELINACTYQYSIGVLIIIFFFLVSHFKQKTPNTKQPKPKTKILLPETFHQSTIIPYFEYTQLVITF